MDKDHYKFNECKNKFEKMERARDRDLIDIE